MSGASIVLGIHASAVSWRLACRVWLRTGEPLRLDAAARRMMLASHRHLKRLPKLAGPRLRRPAGS
jgi:hypothetical protein